MTTGSSPSSAPGSVAHAGGFGGAWQDVEAGSTLPGRAFERAIPQSTRTVLDRPPWKPRIPDVLAAWRAAERDLADVEDEAVRACLERVVSHLRALHGRLFDEWTEPLGDRTHLDVPGSRLAATALAFVEEGSTVEGLEARFVAAGARLTSGSARDLFGELEWRGLVRRDERDPAVRYVLTGPGRRVVDHGWWNVATDLLKDLEDLRTDLLSVISHELRTPITVIRTLAGLLLEPTSETTGTQRRTMLLTAERNAERMQDLVDQIFDPARRRSAAMGMAPADFDAIQLSESVVASIRPLADRRGQRVELQVPRDRPVRVRGDRRRLEQALLNLIVNAHHFAPASGCITVRLSGPTDGMISWSVTDDGPGVAPGDRARLFDRFFARQPDPNEQEGVGLGLPTALAIARAHGGWIDVASPPGRGTTFTLRIPRRGLDPAGVIPLLGPPNTASL